MDSPTSKHLGSAVPLTAWRPGPFNELGDKEILRILEFCFASGDSRHLRLVSRRLARLALPLTLHTLAICSPEALECLVKSPEGPLFNGDLSRHVLCLEIRFAPHDFVIISEGLPRMCPNLIVVRFRFDLGVDPTKLPGEDIFQRVLTHDSVFAEKRRQSYQTWLQFLSNFNPKKFEWVSSDHRTLRLVGVHSHLRQLLASWKDLELIFLDGICLLEDNEKQWRVWLPTKTVAIRGPFYDGTLNFLYKVARIQASPSCQLLMLESCDNAHEMQQIFAHGIPAVSLLDNTLVTTVGWAYSERDSLILGLTRYRPKSRYPFFTRPLAKPVPAPMDVGKPPPIKRSWKIPLELLSAIFLVLICLVCHVLVVFQFAPKGDITRIYPMTGSDKLFLLRVPDLFKTSKPPGPQNKPLPMHIVSTPSSAVMDPIALPSCWCSCEQPGTLFPSMKKVVYS
ncbi:hypothetical protein P691DRAFT_757250 [Macrolepiota fuliginosa MF-IS2]|uniref:Uncharacterized protein n=1 Tax=Macrolepiota fuliginosa MF-IS2 TaxID=1400762 RepID=A0A9P6C7W2_9AGAR|nr:hypothetical protein P691DRAFT_757250 [Macrolepiota fuliginosa MF-IS2]